MKIQFSCKVCGNEEIGRTPFSVCLLIEPSPNLVACKNCGSVYSTRSKEKVLKKIES